MLTGQYDPSLLQQGLVGQAILPATVSGNDLQTQIFNILYHTLRTTFSCFSPAGGDLTVSLTEGLATLEGIHLVCPNVQISGIDPSNINNITLQVTLDSRGSDQLFRCVTMP